MTRLMTLDISDDEKVQYARVLAEYIIVNKGDGVCELVEITEHGPSALTTGTEQECVDWIGRNSPGAYEGLKVGSAHYLWKEIEVENLEPLAQLAESRG